MRKILLSTLAFVFATSTFAQISFFDATDSLRFGTLRSGAPMAIADMNADGLDDIICLDSRRYLYIEYQRPDTSIFDGVFFDDLGTNQWSICIADVDSNGYNDIFTGGNYNGLFLLSANASGNGYSTTIIDDPAIFLQGSNFADIDTDGYPDIFACHDEGLSVPFKNDGTGNFTADYSLINPVSTVPSDNSGNYGSVWTDYDNDGDLDLYISKCRLGVDDPTDPRRLNLLFQNDGNNNFEDVAAQANLLPFGQSWASDFGDIDNDGDMDCFIINHDIANSLYRNNGNGTFTDVSLASGINTELSASGLGMQIHLEDFDNDTYLDLLYTSIGTIHAVLHNNGDGTFTKVDNAFSINERIHSATIGDLNNDGFIDVYAGYGFGYNQVSNQHDRLFYNSGNDNHYLKVNLKGVESNVNAIGARLELYGEWGKQIREIRSGESYGIMSSLTAHFGLGSTENIDSLYIQWPSGNIDRLISPPSDTTLMITEGQFCLPFARFEYSSPGLNIQFTGDGDVGINNWTWTFEGGTELSGQQVNYVFPQPGQYTVCLSTEGSCGTSQYCELVEVECVTLEAFFSHQSDGLDLSFEDFSFGQPNTWEWDFGDGNTSNEQNPEHGYDMPGTYFVCLTITNECGNAGFCEFIPVECNEVTTAFDKDINDLEVSFIDFSSSGTTDWNWDFGDGNTSMEQNPTHTFANPGTYEVCLSIDGVCGDGMYCEQISVSCSVPIASFLALEDELSIDFQDNTENIPINWEWDFGDGNTSTQQSPVHTYDTPGVYTACLIASNVCGIDTFCNDLIITCNAPQAGYFVEEDGLAYTFTDTSLHEPSERFWLIDDEQVSTDSSFSYLFSQPGNYEVCLQVSSICGGDTLCQSTIVTCTPPEAGFDQSADELSVSFTDTSSGGPSAWEWSIEDSIVSNEPNFNFTFDNPGDYEVCLITSSICGADTLCQAISVDCQAPDAGFEYVVNGLVGNFTDTSLLMPTAWLWSVDGSPAGQNSTLTYSFPGTGDYEVCLIAGSQCGSDTSCTMLLLDCLPPVAAFETITDGLTGTFTDTSANDPQTWLWTINGAPEGTDTVLTFQFPAAGTYEVCLEVSNNCDLVQSCQTVTVDCNPVTAGFSATPNELSVAFSDESSSSAISWLWDFGDGNTSTGQNPQHTYNVPGNYDICLTATNSCDTEDQSCQMLTIDCTAPQVEFDNNSTLLTANFVDNSSGAPTSWMWNFGDGNTSSQQNPQHLYSTAGTYTVCLTASSICGSNQLCQDITITCPSPDAGFEVNINDLTVTLSDTSLNMPSQWNWTFGDGNNSNVQNPEYTYPAPGQYIICLTSSSTCGSDQACRQVNLSCAAPAPAFGYDENGLSVSFSDQSANTPTVWLWDFGDGTTGNIPNPTHEYDQPGTYEVCLIASSICGSNTTCQQITVSCAPPVANFDLQSSELEYSFTDNSSNTPTLWLWTFGDGNSSNEQNPEYTYQMPGSYLVCLQASSVCGTTTSCQEIEVACTPPQAAFDFSSDELELSFVENTIGEAETYSWTFGDGNSSDQPNPTHTYDAPGTYTVCLETSSICGSTQVCQAVTINCVAPLATFTSEPNQLEVSFTDISSNLPTSWSWDFGDGSTSDIANPVHTYAEPGTYTICLTVSSPCGSSQFCSEIQITCMAPQANFNTDTEELTLFFSDASANNPSEWSWSFGDGGTSSEQNPQHTYELPGNYLVCLTVSSVCGTTQRCELTEVSCTPPQAEFDYTPNELNVSFQDMSTEDAVAWLWNFGDGSGSTQASPSHNFLMPGTYEVCLTVSNICGNTTTCTTIEVSCPAPEPAFDYNTIGLSIFFSNQSSNDANEFFWNFGDGNISTEATPVHTYPSEGIYEACLTAGSVCGGETICQEINLMINSTREDPHALLNLKIYPNPASAIFLIDLQTKNPVDYRWTVWSSLGQQVCNGEGRSTTPERVKVQELPAGLYWLDVNADGTRLLEKIVVE